MDRDDAADAHAHSRKFMPRECLHDREPQGSGNLPRLTEESWGTTRRGRIRNTNTAQFENTRTRGGSEPGARTKATGGSIVQATTSYGHGVGYDGGYIAADK